MCGSESQVALLPFSFSSLHFYCFAKALDWKIKSKQSQAKPNWSFSTNSCRGYSALHLSGPADSPQGTCWPQGSSAPSEAQRGPRTRAWGRGRRVRRANTPPLPLPAPGPSILTGREAEGQRETGRRSGSRGPQGAGQRAPGERGLQTSAPPRGGLGVAVPETEVGQRAVPLSHGSQRLALPHGQTQAPGGRVSSRVPCSGPRARQALATPRAPGPAGPQRRVRGSHPRPMLCLPDLGSPGNPH